MALMFQRIARNYARNGYFPTDALTMERTLQALTCETREDKAIRIIDPCCGEGSALAEVKAKLSRNNPNTMAYGVEYDRERAHEAEVHLNHVLCSDIQSCSIAARQFGLLWLNPPYGDLAYDSTDSSNKAFAGRDRLEKLFYRLTNPYLIAGGVLVLIIPGSTLDTEFSTWLSRHYTRLRVFVSPERQFKQVVIFGLRCNNATSDPALVDQLISIGKGDLVPDELPRDWSEQRYRVPAIPVSKLPRFRSASIDEKQLVDLMATHPGLWGSFDADFGHSAGDSRRPLSALCPWHMALCLAAGKIGGVVTSSDGLQVLIKGGTHKMKRVTTTHEKDPETGVYSEVRTETDEFVPSIRGVVLSEGADCGSLLVIK